MINVDKELKGMVVNDHQLLREGLCSILTKELHVNCEEFSDGQSLVDRLLRAAKHNQYIDFIVTDIEHPNIDGIELIEKIRNFKDNVLYHNGLRLKHIPIVVLTALTLVEYKHAVEKISKDIPFVSGWNSPENIKKAIITGIARYRKNVVEEFTNEGYSIQFQNGKYNITKIYDLEPFIETKYFEGISNTAGKALMRKILVLNSTPVAKISINIFEELLNDLKTSENELQDFFRLFPEFLLDNRFDVLYSEKTFQNSDHQFRTDIVAQPRGFHDNRDQWTIVELKKPTEKILTNKKYHANFSKIVYNAITQLKNYQEYFNNPQNAEEIQRKFNGILPNPRLSLIIGKTPPGRVNLFRKAKDQFPEISITTYDEVLDFRKVQVQYMENLGL